MKAKVEASACIGRVRHWIVAPHAFQLDTNGFDMMPEKGVRELLRAHVIRGLRSAPRKSSSSRKVVDAANSSYLGSRNRTEQV
jgi:hypothetical protein